MQEKCKISGGMNQAHLTMCNSEATVLEYFHVLLKKVFYQRFSQLFPTFCDNWFVLGLLVMLQMKLVV